MALPWYSERRLTLHGLTATMSGASSLPARRAAPLPVARPAYIRCLVLTFGLACEPRVIQPRGQFSARGAIKQPRDREAVAGLEGSDGGLRLGGKAAIHWSRLIAEVPQMLFRHLNVASE